MKCPKCDYERKPEDQAPDYECPSCGVNYVKFTMAQAGVLTKSNGGAARLAAPVTATRKAAGHNEWADVLMFRKMISPALIRMLFWLFLAGACVAILYGLFHGKVAESLSAVFVAPFLIRLLAEMLILPFRIHEVLEEINEKLGKPKP